jgi:hypothetical protein
MRKTEHEILTGLQVLRPPEKKKEALDLPFICIVSVGLLLVSERFDRVY